MQTGLDPGLMHRVAVIGAGTFDSLPTAERWSRLQLAVIRLRFGSFVLKALLMY